ncbi:unnamed protein product [Microthlaspi erraticum]|uniref:DC1 domain-containing protein n=1 Tax=Microthlaspi erraticum TaxID=1685480 RepID=A0A6D2HBS1_9BRAS|nr:unnamed protein product [Microthlaspi erraticum]CAA7054197.1 unnamed protein product [Microthlaspi erraticum]CAA7061712.1 unnamed protein product [Microthlaspi erraticum]
MESEGVSLPLIHEHLMVPWNEMRRGDCCGRFESITDGYYCKICDFFVHKICGESSEYMEHPLHSGHTLRLQSDPQDKRCKKCGRDIVNLLYRCNICDFDLDLHCANYPPPRLIDNLEPHGHELIFFQDRVKFDRDGKCEGFPYKCILCNLAFRSLLNPSDVEHPSEVNHPYHSLHPLKLLTGRFRTILIVDVVFAEDGYMISCFIIALLATSAWICVVC